jgi:hypothetical protein
VVVRIRGSVPSAMARAALLRMVWRASSTARIEMPVTVPATASRGRGSIRQDARHAEAQLRPGDGPGSARRARAQQMVFG